MEHETPPPVGERAVPPEGCALPGQERGARDQGRAVQGGDRIGGDPPLDVAWARLLDAVHSRVQPEQFETWFRRAALTRIDQDVVGISVQNAFSRDWLTSYYMDALVAAARDTLGRAARVEIAVDPELLLTGERDGAARRPERDRANGRYGSADSRTSPGPTSAPSSPHPPLPLAQGADSNGGSHRDSLARGSDIGLNPNYTFENFVVGPCNRFAHAAAVGVAESPGRYYNPLFLHGNVGLGKTHLLQSISFALLESWPGVRILFLTCETFVNHFIDALENGDMQKFRNKYRNVDVLVVDDIHLLANKERTQEEFFHTFNALYNAGKQIVLSSDSSPREIPTLQERMVSRFKWGLVTEVERPCYETRMAIIKRKSRERGRELPDDVAHLMTEHVDQNIRELEGAVTKVLSYANVTGQPITTELARKVLGDLFTTRRGRPTMEEILRLVTQEFSVKLSDLQSKKRTNAIAYPRQVGMYLARKVTRHSLEEIGGFFGGRDHSTVLYAVDKIEDLVTRDPECCTLVSGFLDVLQSPPQT